MQQRFDEVAVVQGIAAQGLQEIKVESDPPEIDEPRYLYFRADKPPQAIPGMQVYDEVSSVLSC